jgi:hypothetical protein
MLARPLSCWSDGTPHPQTLSSAVEIPHRDPPLSKAQDRTRSAPNSEHLGTRVETATASR